MSQERAPEYARRNANRRNCPARPAVAVSAVLTPAGLLKPIYGDPGAKATRRGDPRKVAVPPAPVAPRTAPAPRVRHGVPVCNRTGSMAALDAEPAVQMRGDDVDEVGLRRLGSEIVAHAVEVYRRAEPEREGPRAEERRRKALAERQEAEGFLRGETLERCLNVFGVRVDPDAVRRALLNP